MVSCGDLQSPRKRKRKHPEGKTKMRMQGPARMGRHKQPHGVAAEKKLVTPREKRLAAKELSEARKMRRKQNYSLEKPFVAPESVQHQPGAPLRETHPERGLDSNTMKKLEGLVASSKSRR